MATSIILSLLLFSMWTLTQNIELAKASGPVYIREDGTVDPVTAPLQRNGDLYILTEDLAGSIVIEKSNTILDGQGHSLTGSGEFYVSGIALIERNNNVTIRNLEIHSSYYGISISYWCTNIVIENNIISGSLFAGIYLHGGCTDNVIENNIISGNGDGIYLNGACTDNVIQGNIISSNRYGVLFEYECDYNEILENTISENSYGIFFDYYGSRYNTIFGNDVTNNGYGIALDYHSDSNNISDNNVVKNSRGIYVCGSEKNFIARNNVAENQIGILLKNFYMSHYDEGFAQDNTIVENLIAFNTECGLSIINSTWGGYFVGDGSKLPNYVYHNIFLDNANHVTLQHFIEFFIDDTKYEFLYSSANIWDDGYPSGGNYWSDYNGVDDDGDGIGDSYYIIDVVNEDRYPLLEAWSARAITKTLIGAIEVWNLPKKTEKSLINKLEYILKLLAKGNENLTIHKLAAFINQVEALEGKKLTIEQADLLKLEGQQIIKMIIN